MVAPASPLYLGLLGLIYFLNGQPIDFTCYLCFILTKKAYYPGS